ncbi:MAG: hypothetical protein ACJASM_002825 [Salibacteraceae bacterium]|jgi:hypothetical protein
MSAQGENNYQIVIPLIKTRFASFKENNDKPFKLWDSTILTELNVDSDLPTEAKTILSSFSRNDRAFWEQNSITAFVITLENGESKTLIESISNWENQLKYFSVFYWTSCGNPIRPFASFIIHNNKIKDILNTPRGNDPDGYEFGKATSHGITHEFLHEFKTTMALFSKAPGALKSLAPFFDLASAGFDSSSLNTRITLWVSALESLLAPGVSNEIAHQIAVRAAFLASDKLEERKQLYKLFKSIYALRSKYVHGESDDISEFSFESQRLNTIYQLKQKFIYPIFRKIFGSEELLVIRSSKSDNYAHWNDKEKESAIKT